MRLVTHNFLRSNVKGARTGYPLGVEATEVTTEACDFNEDLVKRMLPKLDYAALQTAALAVDETLPPQPETVDSAFLRQVHHAMLEIHVVEGALVCPDTGRRYPITNGIPNMLLHEDELADESPAAAAPDEGQREFARAPEDDECR